MTLTYSPLPTSSSSSPAPYASPQNNNNANINNTPSASASAPSAAPTAAASIESTYTSLIQQYLSLLQYDNAVFIAERFVSYKSTPYSNYLLAMCYYRSNKVQYAKRILTSWCQKNHSNHNTNSSTSSNSNSNSVIDENIIYLLAKCNIDLEIWKDGEDVLLKNARMKYVHYKKRYKEERSKERKTAAVAGIGIGANGVNANANDDANDIPPMMNNLEEFLVHLVSSMGTNNANANANTNTNTNTNADTTTTTTSRQQQYGECPIPNGAAGLHLLGIICQRTMRNEKAAIYYQLALKLDPMMWTSYEALCEMGFATINSSKPELDPTSIFGVIPSNLTNIPKSSGGYGPENRRGGGLGKGHGNSHGNSHGQRGVDREMERVREGGNSHAGTSISSNHYQHYQPPHQNNHMSGKSVENKEFLKRLRDSGGEAQSPFHTMNASPIITSDGPDYHPRQHHQHLHHQQQYPSSLSGVGGGGVNNSTSFAGYHNQSSFVPQTPYTQNVTMLGEEDHDERYQHHDQHHNDSNSVIHSTSFFPQTATSITSNNTSGNNGGNGGRGHLPSTTLFATPGLTPIPHQQQPNQYLNFSASSSKKEEVFSRAKQVASRLYYDPSPEMTPPSYYNYSMKKRLSSSGIGGSSSNGHYHHNNNSNHNHNTPTPPRSASSSIPASLKTSRRKQYKRRTDMLLAVDESKQGEFGEQRLLFDGMNVAGNGGTSDEDMVGGEEEEEEVILVEKVEKMNTDVSSASTKRMDNTRMDEEYKSSYDGHEEIAPVVGEEGIQHILELFCTLGAAQRMLCSYHCKEAIQIFRSLPNNQYNTGFVQHQVGRAYFEMADYPSAQRALETMQRVEPHRMKGLELLSTVFWHLKKEVDLSSLAQRVVDFDKMAPESWCVVGNCFSLQKEHETALAFFRRSIQLDASFTYSHTLSGHEYVSNEDFEQAIGCFRNAIRNDDRHYTAWYGLGAIYFRQEKYSLAEYHFEKALSINPQSSVLHCHLGMAQHANKKNQAALDTLARAFRVDPRNPQARYQRAIIWMSINKHKEALKELEQVRDAAPREASIHFAMGNVLKKLDRPEEAMRCFLTALDLDPKDNNLIKAAIDRLDDPDVPEEDVPTFSTDCPS